MEGINWLLQLQLSIFSTTSLISVGFYSADLKLLVKPSSNEVWTNLVLGSYILIGGGEDNFEKPSEIKVGNMTSETQNVLVKLQASWKLWRE